MGTKTPIAQRVHDALGTVRGRMMTLAQLETKVFPVEDFPNAFRSAVQGGPPGCRWMFIAWLRRNGVPMYTPKDSGNGGTVVGPWRNAPTPTKEG